MGKNEFENFEVIIKGLIEEDIVKRA